MHKRREVGLFFFKLTFIGVLLLYKAVFVVLILDEEGTTKDLLG